MAKTTRRTDPHRPGAIVPADYEYVMSYSLHTTQDGWPVPSQGVTCELDYRRELPVEGPRLPNGNALPGVIVNGEHRGDTCCVVRMLATQKFVRTGGTGKCSVCGACYVYGDIWRHEPTGDHIHIGHDCARKYALMADRSAFEIEQGRRERALGAQIAREQNREQREAFLNEHPGLREALETDHSIVRDMADKLQQYRSLSDKQIALVFKLADEKKNPKAAEVMVAAPTGRVTFRGTLVSIKCEDGLYGLQTKCTIKVTTDAGVWLAWGTLPSGILGASNHDKKGAWVEITATLKPGRDPHFAIMKRPNGKILLLNAPYVPCDCCGASVPQDDVRYRSECPAIHGSKPNTEWHGLCQDCYSNKTPKAAELYQRYQVVQALTSTSLAQTTA